MANIKKSKIILRIALCTLLSSLFLTAAQAQNKAEIATLLESGQLEQARTDLETWPQEDRGPDYLFLQARLAELEGDTQTAVTLLEELIKTHPELPEAYNNLALIQIRKGNHSMATELLRAAMQTDPRYQQVYENLGKLYTLLASEAYKKALGSDNNVEIPAVFNAFDQLTMEQVAVEKPDMEEEAEVGVKEEPVEPQQSSEPINLGEAKNNILRQVRNWADAWASQNVENYLSYYSPEFVPSDEMSLADWRKLRRDRVSAPQFIQVIISDPKVIIYPHNQMASVTFLQEYESNTYNETIKKILLFHKTAGKWLIIQEETGV